MLLARAGQVLADGAGEEEDDDDGRRDPERSVQVRVALEDVEEVLPRVQRCAAAREDLVRVYVEELLVELYAPEEALRGARLVAWAGAQEGSRVGLHFGGAGGGVVEG